MGKNKEKINFYNFWSLKNKGLPFTGRNKEIEIFKKAFESILNSEGKIIVFEGEEGIGKSRLLIEIENSITHTNVQVFKGRCTSDGKLMNPINSMIADFFLKTDSRSQKIAKYIKPEELANLSIITPDLLDYYPFEIKQTEEINFEKIYSSFYKFFKRLSKFYPLVFIFDDADNIDNKVIKLLEYLNFHIFDLPILIILCYEKFKNHSNKFKISQQIKLETLNHSDINNILLKLFDLDNQIKFINWLYTKTKGNPFYIEEIIKSLVKMNIISYEKNRWIVKDYYEDFPLQENIISFFRNKINNLNKDRLEILKAIYLLGNHFPIIDLENLQNKYPKDKLLNILHLLELDGIIDKDERNYYKLHHPIIKNILNMNVKNEEKRQLHRKAAGLIEVSYPNRVEDIAFHKTQNLMPKEYSIELVRYLITTSDFFKKQQNWIKAKQYITLAKRISKFIHNISEKDLLIIDIKVLQVKGYTGDELPSLDNIYILIDKLISIGLKNSVHEISTIYIHYLISNFKFSEAKKLLDKIFSSLNKKDKKNRWRLIYQYCLLELKQDDFEKAIKKAKQLLNEIDPNISPLGKWFPTNLLGGINYQLGNLEIAEKYYKDSLEIVKNISESKENLATTYGNLALIYIETGKLDQSIEFSQKHLDIEIELGNDFKIAKANNFLSSCFLAKKDLLNAKKCALNFHQIANRNNKKEILLESNLKLFQIYFEEKNYEKAKEHLQKLVCFNDKDISSQYCIEINLYKSKISFVENDYDKALYYINNSLSICEKKNLILSKGDVLSFRALLYIEIKKKTKAMEDFRIAKKIFKEKKAKFKLYKLFISFGLSWDGKERDSIFLNGLKLLKEFTLLDEMFKIKDIIKENCYPLSFAFLKDFFNTTDIKKIHIKDIQIYTFGGLLIKDNKIKESVPEKVWGSKKAKELMGLLLVLSHKKGVTREIISSHLWPDKGSKEAQNNFHVTISHLRKVIGNDTIICDEPFYKLDKNKVWSDYFEFIKLDKKYSFFLKQSKNHKAEEIVRKLIYLYKGDFLPEMYSLPIDDEMSLLKIKIKDHILWLLELLQKRFEWKEVLAISKKLLQIDPTDERAHRHIIKSLYEQGDRSGVIKQYKRLKHILKIELDVDPEPETLNLIKKFNINIK